MLDHLNVLVLEGEDEDEEAEAVVDYLDVGVGLEAVAVVALEEEDRVSHSSVLFYSDVLFYFIKPHFLTCCLMTIFEGHPYASVKDENDVTTTSTTSSTDTFTEEE